MSDVVILVPRRADHGVRDRLWGFSRVWWANLFPDWPIVEGHHDDGPFNRSAAINTAARLAGDWDVAVIIDADVLPEQRPVLGAVKLAAAGFAASAFAQRRHLSKPGSAKVMAGYRGDWRPLTKQTFSDSVSGAYVVGRDLFERAGGFDEGFRGWGWEDVAFKLATETLAECPMVRTGGTLWHLWHPTSPERNERSPLFVGNRERARRYRRAAGDPAAMRDLLDDLDREVAV